MPTFEFTGPDGKTYEIQGPDGATQEQAFSMLQQQLGNPTSQQPAAQPQPGLLDQVGRSAGLAARMGLQAATGTVGMVGDALNKAVNYALPDSMQLKSPSRIMQAGINAITPTPTGTGEKVGDFVGSVLAGGLGGGVDPLARAITSRLAPAANTVGPASEKLKTLAEAKPLGFVATPSTVGAGPLAKTAEFAAGKSQLNAAAATKNQEAYDALARRVSGLPADAPLTKDTLQQAIQATYQAGYQPIEQLGRVTNGSVYRQALDKALTDFQGASRSFPAAVRNDVRDLIDSYRVREFNSADAIKATQLLRDNATAAFQNGNPQLGKTNMAISDALEKSIELNLAATGKTDLLTGFREARKAMAQQYTIRNAIQEGTGSIDPMALRRGLNSGKPFTGELETAAKFANTFPKISGIGKGSDGFGMMDKAAFVGSVPATLFGGPVAGAVTAAAPFIKASSRAGLLTGPGQAMITPKGLDPNILAKFLRNKSVVNAAPTAYEQSGLYGD